MRLAAARIAQDGDEPGMEIHEEDDDDKPVRARRARHRDRAIIVDNPAGASGAVSQDVAAGTLHVDQGITY